jgi:hypothetical protein
MAHPLGFAHTTAAEPGLTLNDAWLLIGTVVVSGLAILIFYIQHA